MAGTHITGGTPERLAGAAPAVRLRRTGLLRGSPIAIRFALVRCVAARGTAARWSSSLALLRIIDRGGFSGGNESVSAMIVRVGVIGEIAPRAVVARAARITVKEKCIVC